MGRGGSRGASGSAGEERRGGLTLEESRYRLVKELEYRTALLGTGGDGCPDALAPVAAAESSCTLGDLAVNDDKSNGLFGEVVRRPNSRRRDEFEVGLSVFAKAFSDVLRFEARRWALADL